MTILQNIGDWKEELDELRNSSAYQEVYSKTNLTTPLRKIPLANILEFATLLLRNEETREAVRLIQKFLDIPPEERTGEFDPRYPPTAEQLLSDFEVWYTLKARVGPNDWGYTKYGQILAGAVTCGRLSDLYSAQTLEFLKTDPGWHYYIEIN